MFQKILRISRKIIFWIFFTCLFLLTTVTVVLHIYEDEIKQYAIDAINKRLNTTLEVQNIELSIFHDFPSASLEFQHVLIRDAYKNQKSEDTLLYSQRMFCNFNLLDIWNGDYNVKRIAAEQSKLNLKTTKDGDVNYDIIKKTEDSTESKFNFVLDLLRIDKLDFFYSNLATGQFYKIKMNKGLVKGNFSKDEFEINSESELFVEKIKSNALSLITNQPAKFNLTMHINTLAKAYEIKSCDLTIGEMPFQVKGLIDSANLDLQINGENIALEQLANSLAESAVEDAKRYNGTGVLDFAAQIKGPLSSVILPSVTASFNVENGTLTEPESKLKVYEINLIGDYQNHQEDRNEKLSFEKVEMKLLNSYFTGSAQVQNFEQPELAADIAGNLDLAAFNKFFPIPNVEKIGGNVILDLAFKMQFFDPEYRKDKFEILSSSGKMQLSNVKYKHVENTLVYENISGDVLIQNNDAAVKNLYIKTAKSNLILNGAMKNLMKYLDGSGSLGMVASVESSRIDLNEFIGESNVNSDVAPTKFELPLNLNLNIDLEVDSLIWDKHEFQNINAKFLLANRKAEVPSFGLNTLGGTVVGSLVLDNLLEKGNLIDGQFLFRDVNMKSLFADWKNFDQETITDKHLSGTGNGSIDLLLFFNPYFSLVQDKMYALAQVEITNGELKNLETMKLVTDYMRSNKALNIMLNKHINKFEEKLLNLKFSTLSNQILIKNRKIEIPKMTISTNALDVDFFGWHDFDNNVEYHFSFRFRDLKTVAEYSEFGKVIDDGLGLVIYLTMSGPVDNPTFSLDKDEIKNALKQNLADEKQTVKSILKTDFGLFKNDSTVQKMQLENKKQVEFIFYDEEENLTDSSKTKGNKKFTGKFFDKLGQDADEQKKNVIFEKEK